LTAALRAAGLVETLDGKGPFTVFAPTDAAFAKLPKGTLDTLLKPENRDQLIAILTAHVVAGELPAADVAKRTGAVTANGQRITFAAEKGRVLVGGAAVAKADLRCSNGIIHVIDAVILPESRDLTEVAADAGNFKTLLAAIEAAGLRGMLQGKGPFTVFAPTDAAFAKLPKGTLEQLLEPGSKEQLGRILAFHVVPGRIHAEQALAQGSATTLAKLPLKIRAEEGGARVNGARIIATDIEARNGVIHVIDIVLLPTASH
jgi:uncharacterized surface protein with fasciclin (FAS1) repeats